MNQINPNDYEGMISLGGQNSKLAQQIEMAKSLREQAGNNSQLMPTGRGFSVAPGRGAAIANILTSMGGAYMQGKGQNQMADNKLKQAQMLMQMLRAQQAQAPQEGTVGPGMMPPRPMRPGQLGGDPSMLGME